MHRWLEAAATVMPPQPHILMCPPDFYGIHYEINPWMDMSRQAEHAVAVEQWTALYRHIQEAGAKVSLLEPVEGLPDLVFTANAAMIFRSQALVSRFRHRQRQGEEPYNKAWLAEHGFEVVELSPDFHFEGAGDALFCGDTLYAGYRMRSDAAGHQRIGQMLGVRVIPVELVDARYYHLDTCFCPLSYVAESLRDSKEARVVESGRDSEEARVAESSRDSEEAVSEKLPYVSEAIWYPPAFDDYGQRAIREHVGSLIEVQQEEAERFACNAVVIGRRVITNRGCDRLHETLRQRGYEPTATPLDEFVKAGGSAKCLTLRLDGEEAAAWKA